jgi:uncharacterized protein (TIGR02118 family)
MIKAIWAANRKPDMSDEAFYGHWFNVHGNTHGVKTGMRRYIQHHTLAEARDGRYGATPSHDGLSIGWFDDLAQMKAAYDTPEWGMMLTDAPNLFDLNMGVVYSEERPIIDGETKPGMVKLMAMVNRHPDLSVEEFQREWFEVHGHELGAKVPGQRRYVQNHPPLEVYDDPELREQVNFDAFVEHWYDDLDAMKASLASPEMAKLREHGKRLFDPDGPRMSVVARETPIIS